MDEMGFALHMLLQMLKSDDPGERDQAFKTLATSLHNVFEAYALQELSDEHDAISATNDTFLKLYRSRAKYHLPDHDHQQQAAFKYVWTAHVRTVIDWQRKNSNRTQVAAVNQVGDMCSSSSRFVSLDEMYPAPDIPAFSPEVYVETQEALDLINRALSSLTWGDRYLLTIDEEPKRKTRGYKEARAAALQRLKAAVLLLRVED